MKRKPLGVAVLLASFALVAQHRAFAQAPAAGDTAGPAPVKLGSAELQKLVAPIALYPDALIAHILPASTAGLDVVQAARFLRKNDGKAEPKPDAQWNTSVFVLLQFPDVLYRMDENLDWTDELGRAVIAQQPDVLKEIQQVRKTAMAGGLLESNDKQEVGLKRGEITIAPADPQVVYVPTYNPEVVVVDDSSTDHSGAAAAIGFSAGVVVGALLEDDDCDWYGGYVVHGAYPVPYGTYAHPAAPYNPRGALDPRGPLDPRGVADPRGIADPRGVADPRSAAGAAGARAGGTAAGGQAKAAADNAKVAAGQAKTGAEQVKATAGQAKAGAEQAKATAGQSKAGAEQAKATAGQAKTGAQQAKATGGQAGSGASTTSGQSSLLSGGGGGGPSAGQASSRGRSSMGGGGGGRRR